MWREFSHSAMFSLKAFDLALALALALKLIFKSVLKAKERSIVTIYIFCFSYSSFIFNENMAE